MTAGEKIKIARKEKKYTQKKLAELCGVATGTIQQYELNKRQPRYEQLCKIASILDIPITELVESYSMQLNCKIMGTDIRWKREAQGLTQKELADFSGLDELTIQRYEDGKEQIDFEVLQKISKALGTYIGNFIKDWSMYPEYKDKDFRLYATNYNDFCKRIERERIQDEHVLIGDYRKLNNLGQKEARKRVNELTEIKKYTEIEDEYYE